MDQSTIDQSKIEVRAKCIDILKEVLIYMRACKDKAITFTNLERIKPIDLKQPYPEIQSLSFKDLDTSIKWIEGLIEYAELKSGSAEFDFGESEFIPHTATSWPSLDDETTAKPTERKPKHTVMDPSKLINVVKNLLDHYTISAEETLQIDANKSKYTQISSSRAFYDFIDIVDIIAYSYIAVIRCLLFVYLADKIFSSKLPKDKYTPKGAAKMLVDCNMKFIGLLEELVKIREGVLAKLGAEDSEYVDTPLTELLKITSIKHTVTIKKLGDIDKFKDLVCGDNDVVLLFYGFDPESDHLSRFSPKPDHLSRFNPESDHLSKQGLGIQLTECFELKHKDMDISASTIKEKLTSITGSQTNYKELENLSDLVTAIKNNRQKNMQIYTISQTHKEYIYPSAHTFYNGHVSCSGQEKDMVIVDLGSYATPGNALIKLGGVVDANFLAKHGDFTSTYQLKSFFDSFAGQQFKIADLDSKIKAFEKEKIPPLLQKTLDEHKDKVNIKKDYMLQTLYLNETLNHMSFFLRRLIYHNIKTNMAEIVKTHSSSKTSSDPAIRADEMLVDPSDKPDKLGMITALEAIKKERSKNTDWIIVIPDDLTKPSLIKSGSEKPASRVQPSLAKSHSQNHSRSGSEKPDIDYRPIFLQKIEDAIKAKGASE